MNTPTIIIIVCVAVAVVGAITAIIIAKKKGKPISSCCGDCKSCPYSCDDKKEQ
ncbi:MAG: FeoB-associated Cys-rich membrane protein [Clostridia bacterium]|nr:FeoB-associated Cys-rich membrane protein [Clostridia bacterium]